MLVKIFQILMLFVFLLTPFSSQAGFLQDFQDIISNSVGLDDETKLEECLKFANQTYENCSDACNIKHGPGKPYQSLQDCIAELCEPEKTNNSNLCQGEYQGSSSNNTSPSTNPATDSGSQELASYQNPLGTNNPNVLIGRIIKAIVGLSGSFALIIFIYGGFMWLISHGNPDYIKKGHKAMILSGVGLVFIFASYFIITVILRALGSS
jgi:hypothetical protein